MGEDAGEGEGGGVGGGGEGLMYSIGFFMKRVGFTLFFFLV